MKTQPFKSSLASVLLLLASPFSFLWSLPSLTMATIGRMITALNFPQQNRRKSKKLVITRDEEPERMSRRLRGIKPEAFDMKKSTRKRHKRGEKSLLPNIYNEQLQITDVAEEFSSSDEEMDDCASGYIHGKHLQGAINSEESILDKLK